MKPLHFSIQIERGEVQYRKGIYDRVNSNMYGHVLCVKTHEWPGQYLDVPGVRVQEGAVAVPAQGPSHPVPWGVTCSLSLGVLEWTGPAQAGRLWVNPPGSLGNWSHPLPLVSAWAAVDYSQRAAAALFSLDQLSGVCCVVLSISVVHHFSISVYKHFSIMISSFKAFMHSAFQRLSISDFHLFSISAFQHFSSSGFH